MYYNHLSIKRKPLTIALGILDLIAAILLLTFGVLRDNAGMIVCGCGFLLLLISQITIFIKAKKYGDENIFKANAPRKLKEEDKKNYELLSGLITLLIIFGAITLGLGILILFI